MKKLILKSVLLFTLYAPVSFGAAQHREVGPNDQAATLKTLASMREILDSSTTDTNIHRALSWLESIHGASFSKERVQNDLGRLITLLSTLMDGETLGAAGAGVDAAGAGKAVDPAVKSARELGCSIEDLTSKKATDWLIVFHENSDRDSDPATAAATAATIANTVMG